MSTCSSACFMTKWSPSSELEQALKEHGRFTIVQPHILVERKASVLSFLCVCILTLLMTKNLA